MLHNTDGGGPLAMSSPLCSKISSRTSRALATEVQRSPTSAWAAVGLRWSYNTFMDLSAGMKASWLPTERRTSEFRRLDSLVGVFLDFLRRGR